MDKPTFESLKKALVVSPDNQDLLLIVLRGAFELGENEEAYGLLEDHGKDLRPESTDDQGLLADICLANGEARAALEWCRSDTPEVDIRRARALLEMDRLEEGSRAYQRAVAANPTLEDLELSRILAATVSQTVKDGGGKVTRLRVLSNDDTDRDEMARLLAPREETVTFADIGGLEGIKKQIHKRIILPFIKPSLFKKFKKRVGGGILLYGPPGCGKTLLARATAGECRAGFFNVVISDVLDMYIGESEKKLHAIFEEARANTPSVIFFDEIEALGGKRQNTRDGTSSKLVSQFLSELDGYEQANSGVLILAATNVPWSIDPAFRRPGRFDRIVFVPPPDQKARREILELHLEGRLKEDRIDTAGFSKLTAGFSGADMLNLVETASDLAIERSLEEEREIPISNDAIGQALKEVRSTTLDWLTTARNYARYANESGQYDDVLDFLKKHGKK